MWSILYTHSILENGRKYELERENEVREGQSIDRGPRKSLSWKRRRTTSRESRYNPSKFGRDSSREGKAGGGSATWLSPSTNHAATWTRRSFYLERKSQMPLSSRHSTSTCRRGKRQRPLSPIPSNTQPSL